MRHSSSFWEKASEFYVPMVFAATDDPGNPCYERVRPMATPDKSPGGRWVVCRSIRKNGRVIYPKNGKCFRFWVDDSKKRK